MSAYIVKNPATDNVMEKYDIISADKMEDVLSSGHAAYLSWKGSSISLRSKLLRDVAAAYETRKSDLAKAITEEMGKPIGQSKIEVDIVVDIYKYYAEQGPDFLEDEVIDVITGGKALIRKEGLGLLLGIMPWNFPYYQVARFAAPNLMNGNAILLKHAPQCPKSALMMEEIFRDAGAPSGLYTNIFATNEQIESIIGDERVAGVSLTGSERAGSAVAEIAGRNLKKVVLELGGSDPYLVLRNADLDKAVENGIISRFGTAGQACNAAKRFIVEEPVYEAFVDKFTKAVKEMKVGDPTDEETFIGPLASDAGLSRISEQVQDAVKKGAKVLVGGNVVDRVGSWFEPTVLIDVPRNAHAYKEELFGPVAVVYKVRDVDDAIKLANDTSFGLSASVNTKDNEVAMRVAGALECGMVYINQPSFGDRPELPFGGVKRSGFGREMGKFGMSEFVNCKLIRLSH